MAGALGLIRPSLRLRSAAAYFVMQRLRHLTNDGPAITAAVHQPSSEVFLLLQDLLLLSGGCSVYFGKLADSKEYFTTAGYPCPPFGNPADHYLRCTVKDFDIVKKNDISKRKAREIQTVRLYDEESLLQQMLIVMPHSISCPYTLCVTLLT